MMNVPYLVSSALRQQRTRAFTVVELLVVIAIVGVMVALLLPAIQSARAAARRAHCGNNLKQLGLALHAYHSTHNRFPPGGTDYGWCRFPGNGGAEVVRNGNGLLLLLPQLEHAALFDQFDHSQAAANIVQGNNNCCSPTNTQGTLAGDAVLSGNGEVVSQLLSVFMCPEDIGEKRLPETGVYGVGGGDHRGAKTNYDFSGSSIYNCNYWQRSDDSVRPMFGENSDCRAQRVLDGLAHTFAFAETLREAQVGEGIAWGYRGWLMTGVDVGHNGINRWQLPGVITEPLPWRMKSYAHAGSLHEGGANFALADGSVHFLSDTTDPVVLEAMSAIADGTVVEMP